MIPFCPILYYSIMLLWNFFQNSEAIPKIIKGLYHNIIVASFIILQMP